MNTEERLRDLMAAYRTAATTSDAPEGFARSTAQREARASVRRLSRRPFVAGLAVAAVVTIVVVAAVAIVAIDRRSGSVTVGAGSQHPIISDAQVDAYIERIRSGYTDVYATSDQWWAASPRPLCRQAAFDWSAAGRQACRNLDSAAVTAARAWLQQLDAVTPPAQAAPARQALVAATEALIGGYQAQLTAEARGDQQAFLDAAGPLSVAIGSLCAPVDQLNRAATDRLPLDRHWCN